MTEMKIYGDAISGNCLKIKYTADYLQQPYTWVDVDILRGQTRTPEFLALNPHGQVPVVQLAGGQTLAQSNAIIRYLAAGSSLLPANPIQQAKVDEWLFWEQYSHEPYIAVCRFHMHYLGKTAEQLEDWRVQRGYQALTALQQHLQDQPWLVGDCLTIADIALLAYTRLAHQGGFALTQYPALRSWISACEEELAI